MLSLFPETNDITLFMGVVMGDKIALNAESQDKSRVLPYVENMHRNEWPSGKKFYCTCSRLSLGFES